MKASLKSVGLDVNFYVGNWDQIKQDLTDGKIQVLPLVGKTPQRESIYDFTKPYMTFYGAIFVREKDTRIKTVDDLIDKEVIVMKGDVAEEYVRREKVSEQIIAVKTYEEAFQLLSKGKHDAVVAQQRMGTRLLKKLGIGNVVAVDYRLDEFRQDFAFAVKDGDTQLLAMLNKGLAIVIKDGIYDELYQKWFAEPEQKQFYYLPVVGLILVITAATALTSLYLIKRK